MTKNDGRWCAGLVVAALLLRLAHWATLDRSPFGGRLLLDPQYYDAWARRIAAGSWIGDQVFFQDPAYAYFLAVIYALTGPSPRAALAIQMILGASVPALVYLATRRAAGEREAQVAGVIAVSYLPALVYEGLLEKTWLATWALAAMFAAGAHAEEHQRARAWVVGGIFFGLAVLARGNLILVAPVLVLGLCWGSPRDTADRRRWRYRRALALSCAVACVLLPVTLRNRAVTGEWFLSTANAGQNFYIGNNPANLDGEYAVLPFVDPDPAHEESDFAREAERRSGRPLTPGGVSRFWMHEGIRWVRNEPVAWCRVTGRKLRALWGAYEIPDTVDVDLLRADLPVLKWPLPGFGIVGPLAIVGAAATIRRRGFPRLWVLFIVAYTASVIAFFVLSRFRMAMMPAIYPLAGIGAVLGARALADFRRSPGRAALVLLGFAASVAWVILPVRGPEDAVRVRAARAVGLPFEVVSQATSRFNLGVLYAAEAKLSQAEAEFRAALATSPGVAKIWIELGKVLARQERYDEARAAFERGLALDPGPPAIWHALGIVCRRAGDLDCASRAFETSVARDPGHAGGWVALGETRLATGRAEDAATAFRRALTLDPTLARARQGLSEAERAPIRP